MAELCRVSLRHLERSFKRDTGFTPRVWLRGQRLKTALVRLQAAASIKEIAYTLHYRQVSHFCRDFKSHFGMTPSDYRRLPKSAQDRLLAGDNPIHTEPSARGIAFRIRSAREDCIAAF